MANVNDNVMDGVLETTIQAYLAQMDSAMKVSELLAKHANSEEITVDHIIGGLVFRLMVPMNNEELEDSIRAAKQIMEKLDDSDSCSESEYDEIEEIYENIDFGSRKVIKPVCNCSICSKLRVCFINYSTHECSDPLAQRFKDAIDTTSEKHKIYI
jgi:hypothetical protein